MDNFTQYLIIGLITLLFAKEYLPAILAKWGIKVNGKNGSYNSIAEAIIKMNDRVEVLQENHISHLTDEMAALRKQLDEHAKEELQLSREVIRLLDKILVLMEKHG